MSIERLIAGLESVLHERAEAYGFSIRLERIATDSASWQILKGPNAPANLEINGEVYDLAIPNDWHFYAFKYHRSMEVAVQLLEVLGEYARGQFTIVPSAAGTSSNAH